MYVLSLLHSFHHNLCITQNIQNIRLLRPHTHTHTNKHFNHKCWCDIYYRLAMILRNAVHTACFVIIQNQCVSTRPALFKNAHFQIHTKPKMLIITEYNTISKSVGTARTQRSATANRSHVSIRGRPCNNFHHI